MQKLCLIIPAYNEEKRIGKTLAVYSEYFQNLYFKKILDYEVLVVINGTTDETEKVVKNYILQNGKISYLNLKEGGKGKAIINGFKTALYKDFDLIGFVDADLATMPDQIYRLIKSLGKNDGAIADRSLPKSRTNMSFLRKITHTGFNIVVRSLLFLPYTDTQCGAKVFTRKTIQKILEKKIHAQWAFDAEVLYNLYKSGSIIKSVPTTWIEEQGSHINLLKTPFKMFSSIVRLRILNSPLKSLINIYDELPEKLKIHNL